jgi:signal transduction histidine kinase
VSGASPNGSRRRLRSTMDSVLIHDMKNMEFRLNLLLSNLEEHYGDPDFKRSVVAHLNATLEKIETIVDRWAAHEDAVLIKVSLDLNDLVREVVRETEHVPLREGNGSAKGLQIHATHGEIPHVWGDPYYLHDAFASIFHNAFEAASASGSSVHVTTREQKARRKRYVVIEISDDGAGMTPEFVQRHLFRPFKTTKPNGVGLGLYTARQIILFHRGDIEVLSEKGRGTRVRISLPAASGSTS